MRQAACVVVQHDGKLLIVARKNRSDDWNLPGGKYDEGDQSLERTAIRELEEETGIKATQVQYIFSEMINDICVAAYLATEWQGHAEQRAGEAPVRWGVWEDILGENSAFHNYNNTLYSLLDAKGMID